MDLRKAFEIQMQHYGRDGSIKVDSNGYVCLNDLNAYYPTKRLDVWLKSETVKAFIAVVERNIQIPPNGGISNVGNSPLLESAVKASANSVESTGFVPAILAKRGKTTGGTYAHKWVAQKFAMWLSPEFELDVIRAYEGGTQRKQDWNIKRILAANNYKLMCDAVKDAHDPVKHYHFSNEAKMLNVIVFGQDTFDRREATEAQLEALSWIESHDATLNLLGMSYQDRKATLSKLYQEKYLPEHKELLAVAS